MNIPKVPGEVLKAEGDSAFNTSRGTLRMLMNGKIMFDCYYCITSTKPLEKRRKYWHTLFYKLIFSLIHMHAFRNMLDSSRDQVLII